MFFLTEANTNVNHTYTSSAGDRMYNYFYLTVDLVETININTIKLFFNGYDRILSEGVNVWISSDGFVSNVLTSTGDDFFANHPNKISIDESTVANYVDDNIYYEGGSELDIANYLDFKEVSLPKYEMYFNGSLYYDCTNNLATQNNTAEPNMRCYFSNDLVRGDFDISFAFKVDQASIAGGNYIIFTVIIVK